MTAARLRGLTLAAATAVVAPLLLVPQSARAADNCTAFNTISASPYYLNNNVWGRQGASGKECTWLNSYRNGNLNWDTTFDWTGDRTSVKAYASAVLGWHWGWKEKNTRLPIRLDSGRRVTSNWSFKITQNRPTVMNVSYDLWFHQKSNPDWRDQPHDEVMVWLNRQNGAGPLGTKRETLSVGGVAWDLYVGKIVNKDSAGKITSSWNVYSFVRRANTTSQTTDLTGLTDALVRRRLLGGTTYLTSVEAGTEVFTGTGRLSTSAYSVTVR
ncbi:GH12 family glycosyl hydrolase domain-containing protein [Streptomyces acidiscabies]|uniref:GH12 family glycosyl hydrolase domain-containing protein n=1 Tax=Streptomyces acidiscabies TaxID=42234 RepID=UPI00073F488C|nr:endo-1,4-beta-glucanase [Streptomyces acidiscabies]GAQ52431.1 endoglucanase S precursor [Streptomyces acidiscabies]GAV43188.1 endoglucanase S precursor [Streptomyces acidiscabies]